ncbi:MAG: hypothetical protein ACJAVT_001822 [Yoonia sp.]|jgi:hypothetical protein
MQMPFAVEVFEARPYEVFQRFQVYVCELVL